MAWVVDTCLLLDIGLDDPQFAENSERLLTRKGKGGLVVCPVTFVELAPAFGGQSKGIEEFLFNLGVAYRDEWSWEDTRQASTAWSRYVQLRRAGQITKRPVADVFIGAFASRHQGLLTRNGTDFEKLFPKLSIVTP